MIPYIVLSIAHPYRPPAEQNLLPLARNSHTSSVTNSMSLTPLQPNKTNPAMHFPSTFLLFASALSLTNLAAPVPDDFLPGLCLNGSDYICALHCGATEDHHYSIRAP